ncbi:hypothetical protein MJO29_004492 [Puccinia striiformis f. sp. tritici]|nr:hypothetical protein MJO29_004492 [Puccinia striiformis f. sp. tritici]
MPSKSTGGSSGNANSGSGYSYRSSGTNSQGNHYCSRDYGSSAPNPNSYHYSNADDVSYPSAIPPVTTTPVTAHPPTLHLEANERGVTDRRFSRLALGFHPTSAALQLSEPIPS